MKDQEDMKTKKTRTHEDQEDTKTKKTRKPRRHEDQEDTKTKKTRVHVLTDGRRQPDRTAVGVAGLPGARLAGQRAVTAGALLGVQTLHLSRALTRATGLGTLS